MPGKTSATFPQSLARFALFCCAFFAFVGIVVDGKKYDEDDAVSYLKKINADIQVKTTESVIASWAYESNITDENLQHQLSVAADLANYTKEIWKETVKYPWKTYKNPDVRRQFQKFTILGTAILPSEKYERYNKIVSDMQSVYGKAKICNYRNQTDCSLQLEPDLTEIFAQSQDPDELKYYWKEWRNAAGKPVRKMYKEYVDLSNEAAVLNNFTNAAEFWLKDYEASDFRNQVEELWEQVKPLYLQLHAYVRRRLREQYGEQHVSKSGPIPAHLLGNMWAQTWGNIYNFTVPYPGKASTDVTETMIKQGYTPIKMFKLAEEFFTSLDLSPMPETFWKNSILEKPNDGRDLICHASAWDFYDGKDFRIKQCTRINMEDLNTAHHEMGHIQYFLQYKIQPLVFKEGTNPGFHEAIGDVMALSVSTPKHLKKIGLLNATEDDEQSDINQLFNMALDKIAFLPFGYLMDQWRWSVFEGATTERNYNCKWWQLREQFQGLSPSVERSEIDFDPGAKYHTIANVPYIRYFVSFIIQFQFHRSLCIAANEYDPSNPNLKPLHQCDIYQSKEAGALLKKMLQMGSSKPWPDAMEVMTGQRKMDASALLDYFATLKTWLEKENARTGETIGWETLTEGWQCQNEETDSRPSEPEGNLGGDNAAYSYAEFVQQDDNLFGIPDFMEETKPSYHTSLRRPKNNEIQGETFWQGQSSNLVPEFKEKAYLTRESSQPTSNENVLDITDLENLQKKLEAQDVKQAEEEAKAMALDEMNLKKVHFKAPFEIRSKYNEMERSKILNAILKDLHNMKSNKVHGGSKTAKGKRDWTDSVLSELIENSRIFQKGEANLDASNIEDKITGDKAEQEEQADQGEQKLEEKIQVLSRGFKLKEERPKSMGSSPLKSPPLQGIQFPLSNPSLPLQKSDRLGALGVPQFDIHNSASDLSKLSFPSIKNSPSDCVLDTSKILNEKQVEAQGAVDTEILQRAEMVKKGAEQVLSRFNSSEFKASIPNIEMNGMDDQKLLFHLPNQAKPSIPLPFQKSRNLTPTNHRSRFSKLSKKAKIYLNAYEKFMRDSGYSPLKSRSAPVENWIENPVRDYDLLRPVPFPDSPSLKDSSGKESVDKKRKAQSDQNGSNQFVLFVGKLLDERTDEPFNNKGYVKKSYKEYHYNVRTPVVYNSVVISNKGDKNDEPRDSLSGAPADNEKRNSDEQPENEHQNSVAQWPNDGVHEANLNIRFPKSVRRKQININNILQYFGLSTNFLLGESLVGRLVMRFE